MELKQSDLGLIPSDWEVKPLQELCRETISYGIVQCGPHIRDGVPYIRVSDMDREKLDVDRMLRTAPDIAVKFKRSRVETDDLVYALRGRLGDVRKIPPELNGANLTQGTARIAPKANISSQFLIWAMRYPKFIQQAELEAKGTTFKEITLADLRKLRVLLPTKKEQELIANSLNGADAYIEALEKLIVKKRLIKQGVMQELLTGKRRLPGFSGAWLRKTWGDVIQECSSGATPFRGRPEYYKGNVRWITSGELNYNLICDTVEHISEDAVRSANLKIHPAGTFLMAITGLEAAGTRGACGIVGAPAATNQSCMAIYPTNELRTDYLFHYYRLKGNDLALTYCQGTKQQSYTAKLVRLLPIEMPPTSEEQQAIATVLSEMDLEIAMKETELEKAQLLKRGMMQALLTGRIRLV